MPPSTSPRRSARACRWLMSSSLLLLCAACATPAPQLVRPDPPPANLTQTCETGPEIPEGDTPLGELLDVWVGRESAAAVCRDRHGRLSEWVREVTRPPD